MTFLLFKLAYIIANPGVIYGLKLIYSPFSVSVSMMFVSVREIPLLVFMVVPPSQGNIILSRAPTSLNTSISGTFPSSREALTRNAPRARRLLNLAFLSIGQLGKNLIVPL